MALGIGRSCLIPVWPRALSAQEVRQKLERVVRASGNNVSHAGAHLLRPSGTRHMYAQKLCSSSHRCSSALSTQKGGAGYPALAAGLQQPAWGEPGEAGAHTSPAPPHHTLARHAPYTRTPRNEFRTVRPGRRRPSEVMGTAGWRPQQLSHLLGGAAK